MPKNFVCPLSFVFPPHRKISLKNVLILEIWLLSVNTFSDWQGQQSRESAQETIGWYGRGSIAR